MVELQFNGTSVLGEGRKYIGKWDHPAAKEKIAAWRLRSDAVEVSVRLFRQRKKDKADNELKALLEPVREILNKNVGVNRQVKLAIILEYLTR